MPQTFYFTADATSEVLSFLAIGTPISPSVPPFSLLDSVSMMAVPEPSTWATMVVGFGGLGFAAYRRRRNVRSSGRLTVAALGAGNKVARPRAA